MAQRVMVNVTLSQIANKIENKKKIEVKCSRKKICGCVFLWFSINFWSFSGRLSIFVHYEMIVFDTHHYNVYNTAIEWLKRTETKTKESFRSHKMRKYTRL